MSAGRPSSRGAPELELEKKFGRRRWRGHRACLHLEGIRSGPEDHGGMGVGVEATTRLAGAPGPGLGGSGRSSAKWTAGFRKTARTRLEGAGCTSADPPPSWGRPARTEGAIPLKRSRRVHCPSMREGDWTTTWSFRERRRSALG